MKTPLYAKVQKIASDLIHKYTDYGHMKVEGNVCAYCGRNRAYLHMEHRSYDDALSVQLACGTCNKHLGAAIATLLNLETLEREPIQPYVNKDGWRAKQDTRHLGIYSERAA